VTEWITWGFYLRPMRLYGAALFIFAANVVVWGGIIYYVYTIRQRNRALEKDLELLKETLNRKG